MGSAIGSAFGKKDPNATNDTLNGQIVATGTPGAKTVADPSQGLSGVQQFTRSLAGSGLGALSQLGQQGQQRNAPQPQINFAPQSPQYQPQQPVVPGMTRPKPMPPLSTGNPFFGNYGGY